MDRTEAIKILKEADSCFCKHGAYKDCHSGCRFKEALDMAISSLEVDEAYQLLYEKTTKKDLVVECKAEDCVDREKVKEILRSGVSLDCEPDQDYVCGLIDELPSAYPKNDKPYLEDIKHSYWNYMSEQQGENNG